MRTFQTTYKTRDGKRRTAAKWYVELPDHRGIRRRLPGFTDKKATASLGRTVEKLAACRASGEPLTAELRKWLEGIPARILQCLARWGLLDGARLAAGMALSEHLDDFKQALLDRGNTAGHVRLTHQRVRDLLDGAGATLLSEIDGGRVAHDLANRRREGLSAASSNHYLRAGKSFTKWLIETKRLTADPLVALRPVNAKTDRRHERRALTTDEARRLLAATADEPDRFKMTGPGRAMLYRLAIESGLRAGELRSLTAASFDLTGDPPTVSVEAAYSKHRRRDVLPLRPDTAALLADFIAVKMPGAFAFAMPSPAKVAPMLRADLAAAGIPYADDAGRVCDFHSLRHTCATLLVASGASPKAAQAVMRHSTFALTMDTYSHKLAGQDIDAVAALPDLGERPAGHRAVATGTDDAVAVTDAPESHQSNTDGKGRLSNRPNVADAVANGAAGKPQEIEKRLALCLAHRGGSGGRGRDRAGQEAGGTEGENTPVNTGESAILQGKSEKAAVGFEPTNNGFAIRRLGPLGYAAVTNTTFYPQSGSRSRQNRLQASV